MRERFALVHRVRQEGVPTWHAAHAVQHMRGKEPVRIVQGVRREYAQAARTLRGLWVSWGPTPLALCIKMIRIQRPRAMISWYEPCLDPPWALLPLEPRVRPLVGHFGLASIGTERTPHRPAYIIGWANRCSARLHHELVHVNT